MNQSNFTQPFLWEDFLRWVREKLKTYRVPLLSSTIVGFLSYMFFLTNKLPNHDEACSLFSKGGTAYLGRWFLMLADSIFPNFSMPWIYGVIAICLIAIGTCLIIHMFQIRSKLIQGLLAAIIVAFPSVLSSMAYMFQSSTYSLAFLLAVLAAWLVTRWNKWCYLFAIGCIVISLATYQGFIALAASLLVLMVVFLLLNGEPLPSVLRKGVTALAFLIVSLGIYYLSTQVVNRYLGIEFGEYASDRMQFSLADIPANALLAYERFFDCLLGGRNGLVPTSFSKLLHLTMLACCGVLLVLWFLCQKKKEWGRYLLLAIMLLLLPLAICCMLLFTTPDSIHTLVLYSFTALYVLIAILAENPLTLENWTRVRKGILSLCVHLIPLCLALVIVVNVYVCNAASLNMHLRYEMSYSFYTALIANLRMMPEFSEDSKLAVIGFFSAPEYYETRLTPLHDIVGTYGIVPSDYSKEQFLRDYLNFQVPCVSDEEAAAIAQTPEFQEMPLYPYYGSMKWFGDTLVVKIA